MIKRHLFLKVRLVQCTFGEHGDKLSNWLINQSVGNAVVAFVKSGYLDFSHLTELKNIWFTEIYMKKTIQIINN